MSTRVILAGATGWTGSELARGIASASDLQLVGAVSRTHAGRPLGEVLNEPRLTCVISKSAAEALKTPCDVFFDYTKPESVKGNIIAALEASVHAVIGTSGLSDSDYEELDRMARAKQRGVLACGNFALTVVLLQKFAEIAARYIPHFEVIDYAKDSKPDAPSGTVRELAYRLGQVRQPALGVPLEQVKGLRETRGATLNGVQVHALRIPGFMIGVEAVFGMPDQRLHLRHESGGSAKPYVDGALLAIRKVGTLIGVHRGLDRVMEW
jgi:4-hydroxy-tetrahydrodipicolinate reductase